MQRTRRADRRPQFEVQSRPNAGTVVRLAIPVGAEETPDERYQGPERRRGGPDRRADGERTKILIVDDHALFRVGIANILGREPDFEVVGEAGRQPLAGRPALETSPDIILMDLSLPAPGGIETTQRIKRELPSTGIIVLAVDEDEDALFDAIKAGAAAFILKDVGPDDLVTIIRRVVSGEYLINDKVFSKPAVASRGAQGVPRAGRLRPGGRPDLRAALAARGRDPRQHRPGHDQQAGRLRPVDLRADRQEPHELDPPQAVGQRPDPGRRLRDAPGLDPDARGLIRPDRVAAARPQTAGGSLRRRPRARADPRCRGEVATLDRELAEIDMLVGQARPRPSATSRSAPGRREARGPGATPADDVAEARQLVTLTRGPSLMEARSRSSRASARRSPVPRCADALAPTRAVEAGCPAMSRARCPGDGARRAAAPAGAVAARPQRQEDLRREIARAMHDGPAQSLTNIVLQAQIVERLLARDPEMAQGEVRQLVSMVQQTLDATKSFIFDVRPMVLDDLGLVPTLRRAARERGQRAGIAVEFDSMGTDRRCRWSSRAGSSGSSTRR